MTAFIGFIELWLLVLSADALVFTLIYKKMAGVWWWHNPKEAYGFNVSHNGIAINLNGNPLEAIKKLWADFTGENQTIEERIDKTLKSYVNGIIDDKLKDHLLKNNDIDDKIEEIITKKFKDKLDDIK